MLGSESVCCGALACSLTRENKESSLAQKYAWDVRQTKSYPVPGYNVEEICNLLIRQEQNLSPSSVPCSGEWGAGRKGSPRSKYQKRYSQSTDPSIAHAPKIWASWSTFWSTCILGNIDESHSSRTGIWSLPSPSCHWRPWRTMPIQGGQFFYLNTIQVSTRRIYIATHHRRTVHIIEVGGSLELWWVHGMSDGSVSLLSMLATSNRAGNYQTKVDSSQSMSMLRTDDSKKGFCRTWRFYEGDKGIKVSELTSAPN